MKIMKQILIVALSLLFFSACTSGTKPNSQPEEMSAATDVTNLRSIKPVAGIPLILFTKKNEKVEVNKEEMEILNARIKSINDHPDNKAWDEQMEKTTGKRFDRMSFGGALDTALALMIDVDDTEGMTRILLVRPARWLANFLQGLKKN